MHSPDNGAAPTRLAAVARSLVDLVYPRDCTGCGARLAPDISGCLCPQCVEQMPFIGPDQCPRCGDTLGPYAAGKAACGSCGDGRPLHFRGAVAVCRYETVAREMVHRLKYARDLRAVDWMVARMVACLKQADWFSRVDFVVPVPLHWTRQVTRRLNQSELLASRIADESGKQVLSHVLRRTRKTPSQSILLREQRMENVRGAFAVARPQRIEKKDLLLVDDVMTTCATAAECARTLVRAGAKAIYVATFAR